MSTLRQLGFLALATTLGATTLEQLNLGELIQKSTGIVRAKVVSSSATLRGSDVYTTYKLDVTETWKGPIAVEVSVPGGVMRGVRQMIAGAPYLVPGEDYILFLWTGKSGLTQVIGMSQGVFTLKVDASGNMLAIRSGGQEMMDRAGHPVTDTPVSLRLTDLRKRVSQAAEEVR